MKNPSPKPGVCDWCHVHFHARPGASRDTLASGKMWKDGRRDHFILWMVVAGHGRFAFAPHRWHDVHGDEAFISPAGLATHIHAHTARQLDVIRVPFDIVMDRHRVDNAIAATDLAGMTLGLRRMPIIKLHAPMFSLNLGQRLLRVRHEEGKDLDQLDAQIQLLRALYMFRAKHVDLPQPLEHQPVHRAYAYLLSHRGDAGLKLQDVAAHVGLSVSHLIRLFRDKYGVSPMKVLARERMAHAKRLLATPDFHVAEIARECGFASSAYFCRLFRAEMNMTPTEYRQKQLYQPLFIQK